MYEKKTIHNRIRIVENEDASSVNGSSVSLHVLLLRQRSQLFRFRKRRQRLRLFAIRYVASSSTFPTRRRL